MKEISLEYIFEQLPCHVYWKDRNGVFWGSNKNNWQDIGFKSFADYQGKTDYDIFPYEQAKKVCEIDQEVIRTGKLIIAEEECENANGIVALYLSHKVPLMDENQNISGILGVSIDITQARKDEMEQLEMLENIIDIMPGHVYWVNKDNVYLGCNDNQAKSAGLNSRKEIVGKRNKDLPWNANSKVLPAELDKVNEEVMQTGESIVVEEPGTLPDGTQVSFLSSKVPMRNSDDKIIGMVGISIDITAEKEAEKLRLEKKIAEDRADTIKLFSASMAHELRTPLRAIQSGAEGIAQYFKQLFEGYEMARAAGLDVPYINPIHYRSLVSVFDNIHVETQALFSILDMLLVNANLSEVDKKSFKTLSIKQCVEQALQRYPFAPDEKELIHWTPGDFSFQGDDLLMIHIIFNLMKNALHYVKAANKGDIQMWVGENDQYNILYFKDTGQGIDAEILPRIFERFFTRTRHGTGVGLAFCQLVMQSFGGDITCESVKGEYTQFTLTFPRTRD
jgi:PAS domain S-box-containing protein